MHANAPMRISKRGYVTRRGQLGRERHSHSTKSRRVVRNKDRHGPGLSRVLPERLVVRGQWAGRRAQGQWECRLGCLRECRIRMTSRVRTRHLEEMANHASTTYTMQQWSY